jgi:hypothetical protein
MVHVSRRAAAVSAKVAAVLVAGVVALPALRRQRHGSPRQGSDASDRGDSSSAPARIPDTDPGGSVSGMVDDGQAVVGHSGWVERGGVPAPVGDGEARNAGTDRGPGPVGSGGGGIGGEAPGPGADSSWVTRATASARRCLAAGWAYTHLGFTPAVWVLLAVTVATGAYGWVTHPDTTVPQPSSSRIEVHFSAGHPARSPITVAMELTRDDRSLGVGGSTVTLEIYLSGAEFAHAGWWIRADVPSGVDVPPVITGSGGLINSSSHTSDGTEYITIAPGPQRNGYGALLEWNSLTSGPMQVIGASLVAVFPKVSVINETNNKVASVPPPLVTVRRTLVPGGDFTYQGGSQPDQFVGVVWEWRPESTGTADHPVLADAPYVEAKSTTVDAQVQSALFYSGIAFGVAASALIAGVVEFVNAKRRKSPTGTGPVGGADAIGAGDDQDRTGVLPLSPSVGAHHGQISADGRHAPQGAASS